MTRFIPADELKNTYSVVGHFYSVQLASGEILECRSVLEIADKSGLPVENTGLSQRQPAASAEDEVTTMTKTNRLVIVQFLVLFLLLPLAISAQDLRKGGSIFARVESNGDVRLRRQIVGRFESDGDIRVKGAIVGRIERDGDIRRKGAIVGKVERDGDVRMNGRLVGKVESDGDIRKEGQIVGRAAGVRKEYAAAIFFFGFFE